MVGFGLRILGNLTPEQVRVIYWSFGGMLVILLVGVVLFYGIRRWLLVRDAEHSPTHGFDMESLERLRDSGDITREEFRLLRRIALGLPPDEQETMESLSSEAPSNDDLMSEENAQENPCADEESDPE
jgi:hypothetical protein